MSFVASMIVALCLGGFGAHGEAPPPRHVLLNQPAPAPAPAPAPEVPPPPPARPQGPFPYDAYSDPDGNLKGDMKDLLQELRRGAWVEVIYEDAVRGDPRARRLYRQLEEVFEGAGGGIAERASQTQCVVVDVLPGCRPHWEWLDFLDREQPGPAHLREVTAVGFARRAKELKVQRRLVVAALSMLVAGATLEKALVVGEVDAAAGGLMDGTLAKLAEATGLPREVLATRLAEAEAAEAGARMTGDLAELDKLRPALDAPPSSPHAEGLWRDYVVYWETRYEELARAKGKTVVAPAEEAKPPLSWEAYRDLRTRFAKGIEYQRTAVKNAAKTLQVEVHLQ